MFVKNFLTYAPFPFQHDIPWFVIAKKMPLKVAATNKLWETRSPGLLSLYVFIWFIVGFSLIVYYYCYSIQIFSQNLKYRIETGSKYHLTISRRKKFMLCYLIRTWVKHLIAHDCPSLTMTCQVNSASIARIRSSAN